MKNLKTYKNIIKKKYKLINKVRTFNGFNYNKYKENRQNAFNKLPIYWAFGEGQFQELLKKLNLKDTPEDLKKLITIGHGGIMKKCDLYLLKNYETTFSKDKLLFWLNNNFQFAYSAFQYEMDNHEFSLTYDIDVIFSALDITYDDIYINAMLRLAFLRAKKDYLRKCNY